MLKQVIYTSRWQTITRRLITHQITQQIVPAACFCVRAKSKYVLFKWLGEKVKRHEKSQHSVRLENDVKFTSIKLYWNATKSIRLGTACICVPVARPSRVVEMTCRAEKAPNVSSLALYRRRGCQAAPYVSEEKPSKNLKKPLAVQSL